MITSCFSVTSTTRQRRLRGDYIEDKQGKKWVTWDRREMTNEYNQWKGINEIDGGEKKGIKSVRKVSKVACDLSCVYVIVGGGRRQWLDSLQRVLRPKTFTRPAR